MSFGLNTLMCNQSDSPAVAKINGQLAFLEVAMLALAEKDDREMLNQMSRSMQTIRGVCRKHGLADLELLSCELCEWLEQLREQPEELNGAQSSLLDRGIVTLSEGLAAYEMDQPTPDCVTGLGEEVRNMILHGSTLVAVA